MPIKKRCKVTI